MSYSYCSYCGSQIRENRCDSCGAPVIYGGGLLQLNHQGTYRGLFRISDFSVENPKDGDYWIVYEGGLLDGVDYVQGDRIAYSNGILIKYELCMNQSI